MTVRPIITVPDPILREVSMNIERVDGETRALVDDMLETMYDAPGIGLAAIQIGVPRRIVVLDVAHKTDDDRQPICMINPQIVRFGDTTRSYEEGCLSLPDVHVEIERPAEVVVQYIERDGTERELAADGLLATAIQHELDHLDGKLIIDFLSRLKRDMVVRKLKKSVRV